MKSPLKTRWPDGTRKSLNNDFTAHLRMRRGEHSIVWTLAGQKAAARLALEAAATPQAREEAVTRLRTVHLVGQTKALLRPQTKALLLGQPLPVGPRK